MRVLGGALLALALTASACGEDNGNGELVECNGGGEPNSLEGSYCEGVSMSFSEVRIKKQPAGASFFVIVDWVTPTAENSLEKTLVVAFSSETVVIEPGVEIPILNHGGSVRRILAEGAMDLTSQLEPAMTRIRFDSWNGEIGSDVTGQVAMLFKSGRTLTGKFGGKLLDGSAPGNM